MAADQTPAVANPSPVGPAMGTTSTPSMATPLPSSCTTTHTTTACAVRPVSPASSFDSSIHDLGETSVKRKRGRPCKVPTAPTYDDFPENGTEDEKKKWKKRKTAEEWCYKKLTSQEAEEYHEKEKAQVSRFHLEKRQELIQAVQGNSKKYQYISEDIAAATPKTKAKERAE